MKKSKEALKILIEGESKAVRNYEAYSAKAREEGYTNIASLFEALSKAERVHIKNHLHALGEEFIAEPRCDEIGTTQENLRASVLGETEEWRKLYPQLIRSIRSECSSEFGKVARLSMVWARKVEKEHARILKKALKYLKAGTDMPPGNIYLCQVCGNLVLDRLEGDVCSVCGHDNQFFSLLKGDE